MVQNSSALRKQNWLQCGGSPTLCSVFLWLSVMIKSRWSHGFLWQDLGLCHPAGAKRLESVNQEPVNKEPKAHRERLNKCTTDTSVQKQWEKDGCWEQMALFRTKNFNEIHLICYTKKKSTKQSKTFQKGEQLQGTRDSNIHNYIRGITKIRHVFTNSWA